MCGPWAARRSPGWAGAVCCCISMGCLGRCGRGRRTSSSGPPPPATAWSPCRPATCGRSVSTTPGTSMAPPGPCPSRARSSLTTWTLPGRVRYGPYPIGYHFTGAGWQEQSAAALGLGAFTGVAVRANTEVIAVGFSGRFTYALRFTGTEWQRLAAGNGNPSPSTTLAIANVLLGIAHAGTSVWAVGYYFTGTGTDSGVQRTLIERYTC